MGFQLRNRNIKLLMPFGDIYTNALLTTGHIVILFMHGQFYWNMTRTLKKPLQNGKYEIFSTEIEPKMCKPIMKYFRSVWTLHGPIPITRRMHAQLHIYIAIRDIQRCRLYCIVLYFCYDYCYPDDCIRQNDIWIASQKFISVLNILVTIILSRTVEYFIRFVQGEGWNRITR